MPVFINVASILNRKVYRNFGTPAQDEDLTWAIQTRDRIAAFVKFMSESGLLKAPITELDREIDSLVLSLEDLTDEGVVFAKSDIFGKWLSSFDKNPLKDVNNVKMLERARRLACVSQ